jgi:hypothetical protein
VGLIWTVRKEKMEKALAEFKFCRLGKHFIMEPSNYKISLCKKVKLLHYCHAGNKGKRRQSFYSFLTSALDGCEWSASHPSRTLLLGKKTSGTHWIEKAGWTSELVWTGARG